MNFGRDNRINQALERSFRDTLESIYPYSGYARSDEPEQEMIAAYWSKAAPRVRAAEIGAGGIRRRPAVTCTKRGVTRNRATPRK
ncbi:hypothetical protein [Saccharopolyspora shandongensis]|uniref:hypothetical protein n=1 Tax=Saccharopolyspora shandongensis TaxID=418495 RepID=UPI00115F88C2|nr:hypothetical protein [Saccharopolyspora shandongensis]